MGSFSRKLQRASAGQVLPPLSVQLERFAEPLLAQSQLIEGMNPDELSNLIALGWNIGLLVPDEPGVDTAQAVATMLQAAAGDEATGDQAAGADLFVTLMTSMVELRRGVFAADRRSVVSCTLIVEDDGYRIEVREGTAVPESPGKTLPS